ncbi:MAG: outer-membrane lipoprotein carrier protein LolA [Candidatus Cloacimonetes bacterium]|nr:outer-membrane lipoprotein carrier protein LolA [Candidatus Cloacimonadota bacterium]
MATYQIRIALSCLFLMASLFADDQLESVYEDILITYSNIKSYEADFQQENFWKELDIIKQSEGKMYYNTDHFLMKYSEPAGQLLLIKKDVVTMYDAASHQALISNDIQTELRPVKLISEYWDVSKKELIESDSISFRINLVTPDSQQIEVNIKNFLITEFTIIDVDDNSVTYKFSNEKINKNLPENIFEITLPEGTNIIDNRR